MEIPRINKSVVKVVQLQKDAGGVAVPVVLYEKQGKRKRIAAPLRPAEKAIRRVLNAQAAFADKYLELHERSSQKNKNGFIRDMVSNVIDAEKAGRKKLKIRRLVLS